MRHLLAALLALVSIPAASFADPISTLPTAGALTGTEIAVIVQGGVTKKATLANLAGVATALSLQKAANLGDVASPSTARTNLGLGSAALANTGTSGATVPLLSAANTWTLSQVLSAGETVFTTPFSNTLAGAPLTYGGSGFGFLGSLSVQSAPAGQTASTGFQDNCLGTWVGGTAGTVTACLVANESAPNGRLTYTWSGLFTLFNASSTHDAAQNVALQATARKTLADFNGNTVPTFATTGASGTGSTATITFNGSQVFVAGEHVVVAGMTPSGYNGTQLVTAGSAGSFSFASATTGPQTVAGTVQDISIGFTWGSDVVCEDDTAENNPASACLGLELDEYIKVAGSTSTTDTSRARVALQIASGNLTGGASGTHHFGRGILFTPGTNTIMDRAEEFGAGNYGFGLDFSPGTFSSAPVGIGPTQKIALDVNSSTGAFTEYLQANGTTVFVVNGAQTFSFSTGGVLNAPTGFQVAATAGVSCAVGVFTPATSVVVGGIITHC